MYFLNINKPKGITSFDCIRELRKKLNIKAIGHSGTLDPLASGVMQIAVGKATKLLDYLESDKTYIAEIKFGYNSTTMDDEGEKTFVSKPDFSKEAFSRILNSFIGKSLQIPPKFSAIKQNGKKLCSIARNNPNAEIVINPREIEIYDIKLIDFRLPEAVIQVHCKKGTYIRSLVYDIGKKLNCGAYMTNLVRTKASCFKIDDSDSLDADNFHQINPLQVIKYERYDLDNEEYLKIMNGLSINVNKKFNSDTIILTKDNKLVSIAKLSDNYEKYATIKPKKNFKEG